MICRISRIGEAYSRATHQKGRIEAGRPDVLLVAYEQGDLLRHSAPPTFAVTADVTVTLSKDGGGDFTPPAPAQVRGFCSASRFGGRYAPGQNRVRRGVVWTTRRDAVRRLSSG